MEEKNQLKVLTDLLQAQAPTIVPRRTPEEKTHFSIYWANLCQKAGIDLFDKTSGDDLTWDECFQIMVFLEVQYSKFVERWRSEIEKRKGRV